MPQLPGKDRPAISLSAAVADAGDGLWADAAIYNLFNLGRHLVSVIHSWNLREGALSEWDRELA